MGFPSVIRLSPVVLRRPLLRRPTSIRCLLPASIPREIPGVRAHAVVRNSGLLLPGLPVTMSFLSGGFLNLSFKTNVKRYARSSMKLR